MKVNIDASTRSVARASESSISVNEEVAGGLVMPTRSTNTFKF